MRGVLLNERVAEKIFIRKINRVYRANNLQYVNQLSFAGSAKINCIKRCLSCKFLNAEYK